MSKNVRFRVYDADLDMAHPANDTDSRRTDVRRISAEEWERYEIACMAYEQALNRLWCLSLPDGSEK